MRRTWYAWLASAALSGCASARELPDEVMSSDMHAAGATHASTYSPATESTDDDLDCAEFHAHAESKPGDTAPFPIPAGEELYRCFYFASPWPDDQQGIRVDWTQNPLPVVHHALLYSMAPGHEPGTIEECAGLHFDGVLMPAFGVEQLPADTGFHVPSAPGQTFMLEIHYINTGAATSDDTGLKLCVAKQRRANTASLTWLGTEDIGGVVGIPPRMTSTVSGTCNPGRGGLVASDDVHLLMLVPHMHQLGIRSQTIVHRTNGTSDVLLDAAYDYADPQTFLMNTAIHRGDTLETRCTFNNTTDGYVTFGPSLSDEMCYTFALAYPQTALDNPGLSLVGAADTCLW